MTEKAPTAHSLAVSGLFLEIFRTNARLLLAGDHLVAPLGLTSARWQLLWTIIGLEQPRSVAQLAREMETNRQGVQRLVNELTAEGLVRLVDNPHHRRARLVELTEEGRQRFVAAQALQRPWVDGLAEGLDPQDVVATSRVLNALCARLRAAEED